MKRFFILSLGVLGLAFFAEPESKASVTFRFGFPLRMPACARYHYYEHRGDHRHRAPYPRHHRRHLIGNVEDRGDASVIPLRGMPGNVEDRGDASVIPLLGMPGEHSSSVPDSSVPDFPVPASFGSGSPVPASFVPDPHSPPDEHP